MRVAEKMVCSGIIRKHLAAVSGNVFNESSE